MADLPQRESPAQANPRLGRLLREALWILLLAAGLYLALALISYDKGDPGPFYSGSGAALANRGGALGAWIADAMLYLFGLSAWWWVALAAVGILRLYGRVESWGLVDRRTLAVCLAGFALVLASSATLESLRLHSLTAALPGSPGGVLGGVLARFAMTAFGFTGATLGLIAVLAAAFSVFTGLSWIRFAERVGAGVEWAFATIRSRIEAKRDREEGKIAAQVREEKVEEAKKVFEEHEPIRIEMPVLEIPRSERVVREKQRPLFADLPDSPLPPLALLDAPDPHIERPTAETLEYTSRLIERKLLDFNVQVKVVAAYPGPVITRYEIEPAVGVKGSQVVNLARDLARALSVTAIRVVETIAGTSCMGLEIPNPKREIVRLSEIVGSQAYADMGSKLAIALGKDIAGKPVVADLAKMPHLLVAGTTGSGKSVAINAMLLSLMYKATAKEVRFILIDPKMLELSMYEGIPHLLAPVVTDMKHAGAALNWCVVEMDRRYKLMSTFSVRNLASYNTKVHEGIEKKQPLVNPFSLTPDDPEKLEPLPLIVVVIDELADLMMVSGKKVEELIARLAQKSRASGIHLILATQRPSVDVITGLIKANVPTRIAFQVSSRIDSRTILDQQGAESLLGQGDMLYLPPGTGLTQRVHGAYVSDGEAMKVVENVKKQGEAQYIEGILDEPDLADAAGGGDAPAGEADPLYDQAVQIVLQNKRASISLVQRHLRIGYNRAARLIEDMERAGMVSSMASNGNREILVPTRVEK
ncbi:cell division protein FtsK [Betaproteobacteria bacterium GR16-43]|nr:cell division protein FtsK [Betaproteobacteria bacterium GR16-43]